MTRPRAALATLALLALAPSVARASQNTQTYDFSYVFTDFTNAATQSYTPIPAEGFVATFNPFDPSLGTLTSSAVIWSITSAFTGVTGSTSSSFGASMGGSYYINDAGYDGNGGGTGTGSGTLGDTVSASFTVPSNYTFLPEEAGVTYDPAIDAALTGTAPFTARWNAGSSVDTFSARYIASGTLSVTGTASVVYTYQPVPEPASALILLPALGVLAGLSRHWRGQRGVALPG